MVTSSRRAGRVTNKTKLLIYRGSDKVDLGNAETIVWDHETSSSSEAKQQHVGAKGVESGELLVSRRLSFISTVFPIVLAVWRGPKMGGSAAEGGGCMFGWAACRVTSAFSRFSHGSFGFCPRGFSACSHRAGDSVGGLAGCGSVCMLILSLIGEMERVKNDSTSYPIG